MKRLLIVALTFLLALPVSAQCIWTDNPRGPSCSIIPQNGGLTLGSSTQPFKTIYGTDATYAGTVSALAYNLLDGSDKNKTYNGVAAGTAYTLTATPAALDFGTTDPRLTIGAAGTYLILTRVNLEYVGATFAANRTVTLKLRRTNNTAGDISLSSTALGTNIVTTVDGVLSVVQLPPVVYTTTHTDDVIVPYGDVSVVPTAGDLKATEATMVAVRLY